MKHQRYSYNRSRPFKFKFSRRIKRTFKEKHNFYIYRSFLTGRKRGVSKDLKMALTNLNLLHLLTPSGLHLSSLLLIIALMRKRFKGPWPKRVELIICLSIYFFLPGYYSLKRVALLRSLFIANNYFKNHFQSLQIFSIFLIIDIMFGTFQYSKISFAYSVLFLGIIFLGGKLNFIKLSLLFFSGQVLIAAINDQQISYLSVIVSPILTWVFTLAYPLLFLNIFFIKIFNYSQYFVGVFSDIVIFLNIWLSKFSMIDITWPLIIVAIIINRRTLYLCIGIITINLLIY